MISKNSRALLKQYLTLNGHVLYVESSAIEVDPTIVLLHHGLGSTVAWKTFVPALLDAGWRVINYDRWGYGASGGRQGLSIPQFQDDVADLMFLIFRMSSRPVILIGHSDGATISAYLAARHPELVFGFISVAAHIYVEPKMEQGILAIKKIFEQDARFREGLRRVHGDRYEQVFTNWLNGWLRPENLNWDMRSELQQISCPTLVVQGDRDEHATPRHAQDMAAAIRRADLWLIPGGRHMFPQENPDEFNQQVLRFLEQKCSTKS